jgi:hypothetical protein
VGEIPAGENDRTTGTFEPPRPVTEFLHDHRTAFAWRVACTGFN